MPEDQIDREEHAGDPRELAGSDRQGAQSAGLQQGDDPEEGQCEQAPIDGNRHRCRVGKANEDARRRDAQGS
jgi:hypothetical protein